MTTDLDPAVMRAAEYLDECAETVDHVLTLLMQASHEPDGVRRARITVASHERDQLIRLTRNLRAANGDPQRLLVAAAEIQAFPGVTLVPVERMPETFPVIA